MLVLDEPNANLDETAENILRYRLIAAKHVGILLISHRPAVLSIADKIMILKLGSMVEYGNADDVLSKMMPSEFCVLFILLYVYTFFLIK